MRIHSTSDVPLAVLRDFQRELQPAFQVEVEERQYLFKSAEPPSWVAFLADADWWVKAVGAYAALYVAEIVRAAAKDTWKDRAKIAAKARTASRSALTAIAASLAKLRSRISSRTQLWIGMPIPDEHWSTKLLIESQEEHAITAELALFVHYVPALVSLLKSERLLETSGAGPVFLRLLDDGGLEARWLDPVTDQEQRRVFRPDAA